MKARFKAAQLLPKQLLTGWPFAEDFNQSSVSIDVRPEGVPSKCRVASWAQASGAALTLLPVFASPAPGPFEFAAKPPNWTRNFFPDWDRCCGLLRVEDHHRGSVRS